MRNKAKSLINKLSGNTPPGTFVISYPKCGRTWLRAIIGKYLILKYDLSESNIVASDKIAQRSGLAKLSFTHDESAMRALKSYKTYTANREQYAQHSVILLARDIKDTLVSAYFQASRRISVFNGSISEFIRDEKFGAKKIISFYQLWIDNQHIPKDFFLSAMNKCMPSLRTLQGRYCGLLGRKMLMRSC
jgi:hypothetical protein